MPLPILYSFRRCPYAMRARLALHIASCAVEHREVILKEKPPALLAISPKATVPVLLTEDGKVIDESLDIMLWALNSAPSNLALAHYKSDPDRRILCPEQKKLIAENDADFKFWLDRYKYADRYPEHTEHYYRSKAEEFILKLEQRLTQQSTLNVSTQVKPYLFSDYQSIADLAIFPFVRQFAGVDSTWFHQSCYVNVQCWLKRQLESDSFRQIMIKHPQWRESREI